MENSVSDALSMEQSPDGNVKLNGYNIRVFKREGEPDVYSVQDVIQAIKSCVPSTAKKTLLRLIQEYAIIGDKLVPFHVGSKSPCQCATAENLIFIISKMKHPIADKIRSIGASLFTRVLGGDQRLHAEVDAARAEQERLAEEDPENIARAFGKHVEATGGATNEVPGWALEWRENRGLQKLSGKRMRDNIYDKTGNPGAIATCENYANQGVLCFEGTTKAFKEDNGIAKHHPVANWMNHDQLGLRRMMQNKISDDLEAQDGMTEAEIKRKAREHRDFTQKVSKYYGLDKFDADHYENRVKKLERQCEQLQESRMQQNKRLKTLERRAEAATVDKKNAASTTIVSLFTNFHQHHSMHDTRP